MTQIRLRTLALLHTVLWHARRTRTRVPEAPAAAAVPLLHGCRATGEQGRLHAPAASRGRSRRRSPAPRSSTASARAAARSRRASRHDGEGVASALLHRAHKC